MMAQPQAKVQQLSNSNLSTLTSTPPFPVITQNEGLAAKHITVEGNKSQGQTKRIFLPWPGPSLFGAIVVSKTSTDPDGDSGKTPLF